MDQEKAPAVLCSHFNPQLDKKKLWAVLEEWNKAGAQCYKNHLKGAPAKCETLLINLGSYKLACSKYTDTKCMMDHLKAEPDLCIALNPGQAYVWCYKCDISFGEIGEMFDHDTCTSLEKEKFRLLCAYETTVLSLLQKANANEAFDGSDDEKQSQAKTGTMDEEVSDAQSYQMEDETAVVKGPYPALRRDKDFRHRMFGVSNIGNTCFFNATMQCLNASRPFVQHYVLSQDEYNKQKEYLGKYDNFNLRYAKFLAEGNLNSYSSIGPRPMFDSVCLIQRKYRSMSQQDAPELFRYFLEGLIHGEEQILKSQGKFVKNPPNITYKLIQTPVERIFGNYQAHRVECLECDYKSWTFHFSIDINLDIDKEEVSRWRERFAEEKEHAAKVVKEKETAVRNKSVNGHYQLTPEFWDSKEDPAPYIDPEQDKFYCPAPNYKPAQSTDDESTQLTNLLDDYFHREILNDQENYYCCAKCRKKAEGKKKDYFSKPDPKFITKTFYLYNPGPVLVIVLKRFKKTNSYSWMSSGGFTKIDTNVKFPFNLDMTKYFLKANNPAETFRYSLHGIVVHGGGLGGGHYTAYAKHTIKGVDRWYYASDSHVSEVDEAQVARAQAYMLFYTRV